MNSRVRATATSMPVETSSKKVKMNSIKRQIDVYCRFRPISKTENRCEYYKIDAEANMVELNAPNEIIKKNQHIKKYNFTKVFSEESQQQEVYDETVRELLLQLLNTRTNGLVFTYGVTNAGKTHTTIGCKGDLGILPRLLEELMAFKATLREGKALEFMSSCAQPIDLNAHFECFEIYNEDIFDLNPDCKKGAVQKIIDRPKLRLKDGPYQTILVDNLNRVELCTPDESAEVIDKCLKNRQVASTALNASSSRSHTIFKISVELLYESIDSQHQAISSLGYICVVDLAGSERAKRTENNDNKLKEAGGINNSLMVLGRCLQSIKKGMVVPFRDCKLTKFLAEYFKVESNIKMITNINPKDDDFLESLRVLNYASIAKEVTFIQSSFRAMRIDAAKNRLSVSRAGAGNGMDIEASVAHGGDHDHSKYRTPMVSRYKPQVHIDRKAFNAQFTAQQAKMEVSLRETMEGLLREFAKEIKLEVNNITKTALNQILVGKRKSALDKVPRRDWTSEGESPNTKQTSMFTGSTSVFIEDKTSKPKTRNVATMVSKSIDGSRRKQKGRPRTRRSDNCYSEDHHRPHLPKIAHLKVSPRQALICTDSPDQKPKEKRSSFYTSLIKQPALSLKQIEDISRQQYLREQKDLYVFILGICGKDFDEADKYYRNEYNESPPRLTIEERAKALED